MKQSDLIPDQPLPRHAGSHGGELESAWGDLASLESLRSKAGAGGGGGFGPPREEPCPEPGAWLHMAMGKSSAEEAETLLAHAAACSACLERLRMSQRVLAAEATEQETAEMAELEAMTPQWQHRMAVELAYTPQAKRSTSRRTLKLLGWSGSALAASVLLAVGVALWWQHEHAPEKLLAEAYTHERTFDLRVAGAGYAPVIPGEHLRGGAMDRESAPLLAARAQIESRLEKDPNDPHWLQLQARADLLSENYDAAIEILDRLIAAGPVTTSLLTDGACAYYQRGLATSSENDRATALDYLLRADEMAPGDPVVLFNEAVVMEDRGQVMNAVETWNRYLKFEHDPKWLAEGQRRLQTLEEKLNQIKSHESRMEQHLATPQAMTALAADTATLAGIDEELSWSLLPRLLDAAFPLPVDRSRGSPCDARCSAARTLLHALAASLEKNHQDPWLTDLLPSSASPISDEFVRGAHALGKAIDANNQGDYGGAERWGLESRTLFHKLGNTAGEDRAEVERVYALQRAYTLAPCRKEAEALLAQKTHYAWINANAMALGAGCDTGPGADSVNNPEYVNALATAQAAHYVLLELRARNQLGSAAVESGDTEAAWRLNLRSIRRFYEGDYPPFRVATTMAGLALIEDGTPRKQLDLLVNKETFGLFELAHNRAILAEQRVALIRAAIRAGALETAQKQMRLARKEFAQSLDRQGLMGVQAESEIDMAELYLDRGDLEAARHMLDDARSHLAGVDNPLQLENYAVARGELELALGHPEMAEATLREAIVKGELQARGTGKDNIIYARADRGLYATLAGVWLAEKRPGMDILALWERYRLRILGQPVPTCTRGAVDCLKPQLERALGREQAPRDRDWLVGQIVLHDRVLVYRARAQHVEWNEVPLRLDDVLGSAAALERAVSSPATTQAAIDPVARRLGEALVGNVHAQRASDLLVLEPDPLLGNLPWPAVETDGGALGLRFSLEESPAVLLPGTRALARGAQEQPLVVGASVGAGASTLLPEALQEARAVARFGSNTNLLLAGQATEPRVAAHLGSAPLIHFAGHATQYDGETRLLLAPTGTHGDRPYLDSSVFLKEPPKAARLIVFSACASGRNEAGWDHGMGDIVDTLAALGVPDVVATRWQIDSASAVPMMDAFYRGLASGRSVPEALTAARLSLSRDPRYRHPYYWAAYYASGAGSTTLREVLHDTSR